MNKQEIQQLAAQANGGGKPGLIPPETMESQAHALVEQGAKVRAFT